MASPKKKHLKIAANTETPDSVFSKKKKKHGKSKEFRGSNFVDEVFNRRKEEPFAATETPKKKKKSKAVEKEAPITVVSKTPQRRPSVEALPLVEIGKSPLTKRSRSEKEAEFSPSPKKKLKRSEGRSESPSESAHKKEKKNLNCKEDSSLS